MMHQDIIQEILVRLPVKSLVKCTCLSQKWHAFISYNKSFHSSYISRQTGSDHQVLKGFFLSKRINLDGEQPVRFLPIASEGRSLSSSVLKKRKRHHNDDGDKDIYLTDDDAFPVDASLSFLGHDIVHVVGSSNGCLLTTLERYSPMSYMICNPLNKQQIVLPKPNITTFWVVHGFICDAALTQYKVVRALKAQTYTTTLTLEIFSSDFPQWRRFNTTSSLHFFLDVSLRFSGVIKEGVTYLPALLESQTTKRPHPCIILVPDITKEIVQALEAPPREDIYYYCYFFGMSDGHIVYGYYELDQLKIWLLNEKGDGTREWSLKHKVNLKSKVENYCDCAKDARDVYIQLIAVHPTNSQVIFLGCGKKRYQYDVKKSRFEFICDCEELGSNWHLYNLFPYTYPLIGTHLFHDH